MAAQMDLQLTTLEGPLTRAGLTGRLDTGGAEAVSLRFTAGVVATGQPAVIDLSAVSFVSSMGIRMLISAAKSLRSKGAKLVIFGAQAPVQGVFEEAALDQIIDIVATEEQAIERARAAA